MHHGPIPSHRLFVALVTLLLCAWGSGLLVQPVLAAEPGQDGLFLRGETNGDGDLDVSDAVYALLWLFAPGQLTRPPYCQDSLDANDDGAVDISDAVFLLAFLFRGGQAPPFPGESIPGADPTSDTLLCEGSLPVTYVVGTVVREETGEPLAGVSVALETMQTTTDADGRFGFRRPPLTARAVMVDGTTVDPALAVREIPLTVLSDQVVDLGTIRLRFSAMVARITSPVQGQLIGGPTQIQGTAAATAFVYYTLEYGIGEAPAAWVPITLGRTPVAHGVLATWDTLGLGEPVVTLRLTVHALSQGCQVEQPGSGDPAYTLRLSPLSNILGDPITVTWNVPAERAAHPTDWIGLYKRGVRNSLYITSFRTEGRTTGTATLLGNITSVDVYEARYFLDGSYNDVARSNPVCVGIFETAIAAVTVRTLAISNVTASLQFFSPNGDGVQETVTFSASAVSEVEWTLLIEDSAGAVVKTLTAAGQAASLIWDGTREAGAVVADGVYTFRFLARDGPTGVTDRSENGTITVDRTPPQAAITAPPDGLVWRTPADITFQGTASDRHFQSYRLEHGVGAAPASWSVLRASETPVAGGALGVLGGRALPNGLYTFRLVVLDKAGNQSQASLRLTMDNLTITGVMPEPLVVDPVAGATWTLTYTLSRPGNVTVRLYDAAGRAVRRTLADRAPRPGGPQREGWDGRDDAGAQFLPMGAYYFTILAEDAEGRSDRFNDAAGPRMGTTSVLASLAHVSAEGFDPYRNDLVTVDFEVFEGPAQLSISVVIPVVVPPANFVRWLAQREPFAVGHHTLFWNGRRENGVMHRGRFEVYFDVPEPLPLDLVILRSRALRIEQVRMEPYVTQPVLGEVSHVTYTLSRSAQVRVTVEDPNGNHVRTLVAEALQSPGPHAIEWDGENDAGLLPAVQGDYRIDIRATDPATGIVVGRTGVVLVYQ